MPVSFLLGCVAGFIMHRAGFCMAGAFRDLFLFRQAFMLRQLLLLVAVSMILFEAARVMGLLPLYPFPSLGPPTLASLVGGTLFGIGMVLAGGCVVGTLYKLGAGNVLSGVAFVGLIAGSALYGEIHPWWGAFVRSTVMGNGSVTLPEAFGLSPLFPVMLSVGVAGAFLYRWQRHGKLQRHFRVQGHVQPWLGALLLSLTGLCSYLLVGMPLGITTSYAKLGASLERLIAPRHFAEVAFFKGLPLDYRHPLTQERLVGGPGPAFDAVAAVQYPLLVGLVLGGLMSAVLVREFHIYYRVPVRQYGSAFAGGVIMGLASRMAPGCNIWHIFGGLPILAGQSLLFVLGLFPGAWLGGKLLTRLVIRD
ncbi:YeeE/YedE family protein [Geomobilimonas luticola]|uniref:YeeE/YedE family protein n=1 Tax=Geomobilimonas luticola TaxID=1114878 RepID=A0ABS5S8M6_9BACT|nr:YeeE/YedE family protein [Geomobilimonas luticola]MBT0651733.1 YeeE/YedE family protein [Geomobilimonas luticola]